MKKNTVEYLKRKNQNERMKYLFRNIAVCLSLMVVLGVFWYLKLTGITMAGEAFCGIDEHVHGEECQVSLLICDFAEEGHTHTAECESRGLICELKECESHIHTDECKNITVICGKAEGEGHTHTEECMGRGLICELEETEGHIHTDECKSIAYSCGLEENGDHTHTEECQVVTFICGDEEREGHTHVDTCYGITAVCGLTECEAHTHTDECKLVETVCGEEEREGHFHTEECYGNVYICGHSESGEHVHTESCYGEINITCGRDEHIHTENCYSNVKADLETPEMWEESFADISNGNTTAEKMILIAKSQLGYTESTINFEVDLHGERRGITRYGQWYGNPYGDWSAMFVMFCMNYAGVEDLPTNAGAESLRLAWEAEELYASKDEFSPMAGDVLFLAKGNDGSTANAMAIITEVSDNEIRVIEGDVDRSVAEVMYPIASSEILGYGIIPEVSEFAAVFAASGTASTPLGTVVSYNTSMLTSSNRFVLYAEYDFGTFAIDGSGNAVPVQIRDGKVYTDIEDPESLLWTFSRYNNSSTAIQNVATGRYLHPYYNSSSDNGITTPGRWGTTVSAGNGGLWLSHSAYVGFDFDNITFVMAREASQNVTFRIAQSTPCTVWLDGTNGGIMSLGGSDNLSYTAYTDSVMTLPASWKSPDKYNYVLKGWYDIVNNKYYAPGEEVVITGNTVFYADWQAASYDVGEYNAQVTDTVSTDSFVTTKLFDYGVLMNMLSENANVSVDANGHSETWNLLTSGQNPYNGEESLGFILRDWDRGDEDISYPKNHDAINNPTDAGTVYSGLYTDTIRDVFFDPDVILPGKTYVGEADHLFQLCLDPDHEHYGYYYYNSERNAASYNQSDGRFYVYDYLEATRDSINNGDEGKYSDFLPFNSPYTNTNGKNTLTYSYEGTEGEYVGTTHYMYDSRYNDNDNSVNNVGTNFWFGMSVEVDFYIPLAPGGRTSTGEYGNKDIYGADMHFRFTGDDDVWIFVDDTLVLDLGGLHGRETGDINFSTGTVTINGVKDDALSAALQSVSAGEHKLTLYYMERGSSMSNCAIYFNLAPRFSFSIEKEDVLTREVLNGAQFSVYTDRECTVPAELWVSKESHDRGDPATNVFTVTDGVANMWGMGAGNEYYIKETKPPDDPDYGLPNGIICASLDKVGTASYNVEILDDGSGVSGGFIVHGFRIDAETQNAYIVATNAPKWVKETTSVEVMKYWEDSLDHSDEEITVYLTVTDADGTVRRLQEAKVCAATEWRAKWENLPKHAEDGVTPIKYGVEESYVSGYYSSVEVAEGQFEIVRNEWKTANTFENGKVYILKNSGGQALSTQVYAEDTGYMWVSEETAKTSPLAQWTASVNGNNVRLTNLSGQTITFYYGNGSPTDFFALNQHVEDNNRKQYFVFENRNGGITLKYNDRYLYSSLNSSQKFENGNQANRALAFTLMTEQNVNINVPIEGEGFLVTNTPLEKETSLTVYKNWSIPPDMDESIFEKEQVTVRLLANGSDTGRTLTLNLKNGWTGAFRGLPYEDADGNVIIYSVQEVRVRDNWVVSYGALSSAGGSPPNYSVTVTNTYRTGGPVLPTTGSSARMTYMLCGLGIMLVPLIYILLFRRRRERRID